MIGVGAGVVDHTAAHAMQLAVVVKADLDLPVLVTFLYRGDEVFAPVLNPFQWSAEQHAGRGDRDFFRIQNELGAEAAADVGRDDANAIFIEAEHLHDEEARFVRKLRRGPHREHVEVVVVVRQHAAAFDRVRTAAVLLERQTQTTRRRFDCRVGVAIIRDELGEYVTLSIDMRLGRSVGHRLAAVGGRRQVLDIDVDQGGRVFRNIAVVRDDEGNRLADIGHFARRQDERRDV